MAPEKKEALLVTDRTAFQYPKIVLGEHEIEWEKNIKYLGMQLDQKLSFGAQTRRKMADEMAW